MMNQPNTINELFNFAVEKYREDELVRFKKAGEWQSLSYGEVARRVRELALGMYAAGFRRDDKIAIWSENRPEWNVADLAVLAIGAVDVPIYTTQSRQQLEYILNDSKTSAIFVSSTFLDEAIALCERLPALQYVIAFDVIPEEKRSPATLSVEALVDKGRALFMSEPNLYDSLWSAAKPSDLVTLIYTSGTTGDPKGVMLTQDNLTVNALNVYRWLSLDQYRDVALTFLPFSHIFERAVWYIYAYCGATIVYAESIEKVAVNLAEVRPTVMTSVPRMFEKLYARILEKGLSAGFPNRQIFLWSLGVGKRWAERKDKGKAVGLWLSLQHKIADALVFKKWRAALGGRIRSLISGGAPLAPEIAYAFYGAGILILQGYGLTETSPSMTCTTEANNRIGSVGKVIDGVSVRLEEDGEILVKGRTVMQGYFNRPDINQEAFTSDGWFRTGDIGQFDEEGYLTITDRKKDLIKTSGGKYVAPQPLESLIKSSRFVSQVVVVGNNRKFISALVVPNLEMLKSYAELKGIKYNTPDDLLNNPKVVDLLQRQIEKSAPDLAKYERIRKVALLGKEMTVESGELTPTLKPRRSIIEKRYADVINRLYADAEDKVLAI